MKKLLTVKDIAAQLNISVSSVYHIIQYKEINFYKIGNGLRIREEDFEKYLEENRIQSMKL